MKALLYCHPVVLFVFVLFSFFCGYTSHSKMFHSCEEDTISVKGFKCWSNLVLIAIGQWGFLSVPRLLWHGPSQGPWHSHLMPSAWQLNCHYLFKDLGLSRHGIEPRSSACEENALPPVSQSPKQIKRVYTLNSWYEQKL